MADKYNGEGYYSPTEYEAFTRIEKEEKAAAKAAAFRLSSTSALPMPEIRRRTLRTHENTAALLSICTACP